MSVRRRWPSLIAYAVIVLATGLSACAGSEPAEPEMMEEEPVQATATITVGTTGVNADAPRLLGVTFEGRTSMRNGANGTIPAGMYDDATGALYPGVAPLWNNFPVVGMRYPDNAAQQRWNWKWTVGPVASRPLQQLSAGAPAQRVVFGFDEFMAMAASRGVLAGDIQVMVVPFATSDVPDAAASAADWVEYANTPNDGSNRDPGRFIHVNHVFPGAAS